MISNQNLRVVLIFVPFCLMSGCLGMHTDNIMISSPSLTAQSKYLPDKVYSGRDLNMVRGLLNDPLVRTAFGVDIVTALDNAVLVQHYDQNLLIPVPTMRRPRVMSAIGLKPFIIKVFFIADNSGASFKPASAALFIGDNQQPLYPIQVFDSGGTVRCGVRHSGLSTVLAKIDKPVNRESILLASKSNIDDKEVKFLDSWTCIALHYDVETPHPSEKFHLLLGDIITPDGKRVRQTIYFSPVVFRSF